MRTLEEIQQIRDDDLVWQKKELVITQVTKRAG